MPGRPQSPQSLLISSNSPGHEDLPYEACLCELSLSELSILPMLYSRIRQMVGAQAEILIYMHTLSRNPLRINPFEAYEELFPALDVSSVRFHGNATTALIRRAYMKGSRLSAHRPSVRAIMAAVTLLALAPFAWVANWYAARQNPSRFNPNWTSAVLHFVVKKKPKIASEAEIGQIRREFGPQPTCKGHAALDYGLTGRSHRAKKMRSAGRW